MLDFLIVIFNFLSLFSFVYILFIFVIYKLTHFPKIKGDSDIKFPLASIIICAYNEEEEIEKTIKKLISVDYPKNKMEIIIVSDSTDRTNEICEKYKKSVKLIKRYERKGKWSALNEGISKAKGNIIVTIDADTIVTKNWLKNIVKPYQDKSIKLTFGPKIAKNPNFDFVTKAHSFYIEINDVVIKALNNLNLACSPSGDIMSFRKEVWKKIKFRNVMEEDIDFGIRVFKNGMKCFFVKNAIVRVRIPINFSDLRYQVVRWMQAFLELKLFSFLILFIFTFFFPSLSLITIIYLILIKNYLITILFTLNVILFIVLYTIFCLKTRSKNFLYSLHLLILNPIYFLFIIENFIRNLLKLKIKWMEYKY